MIGSSAWSDPQLRASIWPRSNRITATSSSTWRTAIGRAHVPCAIAVVKANAYGHGAAQVALALEDAGADLLACADIEEGAALRAAGVRADILVFGALSVSDLDGLFDCRLTPTISTPGAARAVQAAAARHQAAAAISPEDRHRHEPAGVPLRQPPPHVARAVRESQPRARRRLHALRDRRRSGVAAVQRSARAVRARARRRVRRLAVGPQHRSTLSPCRQQRGAAARLARLVRPRAARPAALRPRAAAAGVDAVAHAGHDARQPHRRGEGRAAR